MVERWSVGRKIHEFGTADLLIVAALFAISVHELAHGAVADRLGTQLHELWED